MKTTRDKGLILKPNKSLTLDAYVDADFAGLYGHEDPKDPVSVKSRSGFIITVSGCPVVWKSKLQSLVALSSTESELNSITDMMKVLIPLQMLLREMSTFLGLKRTYLASVKSTVWEDNNGAIAISNNRQMTPRSKWYAIRLFWWKSHAERKDIDIKRIDTDNQLADPFTKSLPKDKFEELRRPVMGW